MDYLKRIKNTIITTAPGYDKHLGDDRTKTSKMLWARNKISFTSLFAPGMHIESEKEIWDRRLKGRIFRHFRYFGGRGEIIIYTIFILSLARLARNNLNRQGNIESLLNDRNVYNKIELPFNQRVINK